MIRVLQLASTEASFTTLRLRQVLRAGVLGEFAIEGRTIGRRGDFRDLPTAVAGLWRANVDLVHAFGTMALRAAMGSGRTPLVYSSEGGANEADAKWLRLAGRWRRVKVLCLSKAEQAEWNRLGVAAEDCEWVSPPIESCQLQEATRASARAELGLGENDYVVMVVGESTWAARHEFAVWSISMLHLLDPSFKLLLWGRGSASDAMVRLCRRLRAEKMLRVAEANRNRRCELEALVAIADLCVASAPGPAEALSLQIAMGSGLPIVAGMTGLSTELLADDRSAALVPARVPRLLARRVRELREDPALSRRLGEAARGEALTRFTTTHWLQSIESLYSRMLR